MIPINLLNKLREVSNNYQLASEFKIIRTVNDSDGYGGITSSERIVATTSGRLISKVFSEEQEGGGIAGNSKYLIVFPSSIEIFVDDKVELVNDPIPNRYYLVINTDSNATEGLFTNCEAIERFN